MIHNKAKKRKNTKQHTQVRSLLLQVLQLSVSLLIYHSRATQAQATSE